MGLFDLFRKKTDTEQEILQMETEAQSEPTPKLCPRCGLSHPLERELCSCGVRLYNKGENFCSNPSCERTVARHSFELDEFFCDRCNSPTVVFLLCEEANPIMEE